MDSRRRKFIRQLCFTCGSIACLPACTRSVSRWRFLSDQEANILIQISEQLIPSDDDPGATDADVIHFFDKQLSGYYTRHQETYRSGLLGIDLSSMKLYGKHFIDLHWEQQTSFLEDMEQGLLPGEFWKEVDQRSFFRLMLDHTMQGFYGSPRHGGNCRYVSYKMLKIDYPHVLGQNRYPTADQRINSGAP